MAGKHYQDADVHAATLSRLRLVFRNFERVCVAFSGGKDSSVTLQLALDVARELGRSPVDVLFIDLEGQYQAQCHQLKPPALAGARNPGAWTRGCSSAFTGFAPQFSACATQT
ncbi:phosphoadenosine phosphosulfate reductase family protein, partial [Pseudomonas aeruginosa]